MAGFISETVYLNQYFAVQKHLQSATLIEMPFLMDLAKPSGIYQFLMRHPFLCTGGPLEFGRIQLCVV